MEIDPALESLVSQLGEHVGLGRLQLDQEGFAALRFGEALVVNLQAVADDNTLMLYLDMGPAQGGEQVYESLLRANLFWRATFGSTLSLSGDSPPHVILAREFAWRTVDFSSFVTLLEEFVTTAEDWTELVQTPPEALEKAVGVRASATEDHGMIRV